MKQKNNNKTKLIEFLTLFTMIIGVVIGGGIYMKNNSLLKETHNPVISIILWGVVGLACILSILVFIEISSSTVKSGNGTLANWYKLFVGRKTASLISLFYIWIYLPSTESYFVGSFIMYFLQAIGQPISAPHQLIMYILIGAGLIILFTIIQTYARKFGKAIQIFGTVFKFIPLIVAFIAGFCLIGNDSAMFNGGYNGSTWSTSTIVNTTFMGGFGAILFSFDGYIYMANTQKDVKHKEVVSSALLVGLIFCTIFYILMALSLFLGSPDGSIQKLFEKIILKLSNNNDQLIVEKIARIFAASILMIISLISINVYTMIGVINIESDSEAKILYSKSSTRVFSDKRAGLSYSFITIIVYSTIIILGFCIPIPYANWYGLSTKIDFSENMNILSKPLILIEQFSSADSTIAFTIISILMIFSIINRKTKKVEVVRTKYLVPLAIISSIMLISFTIAGLIRFMLGDILNSTSVKWYNTEGMLFTLFISLIILSMIVIYFIHEYKIKKDNYFEIVEINKNKTEVINK